MTPAKSENRERIPTETGGIDQIKNLSSATGALFCITKTRETTSNKSIVIKKKLIFFIFHLTEFYSKNGLFAN